MRAGVGVKVLPGEDTGSDCWQQVAWEKPSPAEGSPNPLSIQPTCYRPEIYGDLKKNLKKKDIEETLLGTGRELGKGLMFYRLSLNCCN